MMRKKIYESIDDLILLIKKKGDKEGFDFEDSKIILCLEVIRLELSSLGSRKKIMESVH